MAIGQKVALNVIAWMLENLQRSFGWIGDPFVGKPWHNGIIKRENVRNQILWNFNSPLTYPKCPFM